MLFDPLKYSCFINPLDYHLAQRQVSPTCQKREREHFGGFKWAQFISFNRHNLETLTTSTSSVFGVPFPYLISLKLSCSISISILGH